MSATVADLAGAALPATSLPPAVAKLLAGGVPGKLMAAKGISPLRPAELLTVLYQLTFDAEPSVQAAAAAAPVALPDVVLNGALGEALPSPVIHFFATGLDPGRTQPLLKILYNHATGDETFVALASRLREAELELVVQNEERLLRCPAIVGALFHNKEARMSSVNRAVELCARHGVRVEGIPAFDDVARSIAEDPAAVVPALDDLPTTELFTEAEAVAAEAPIADAPLRKSPVIDFTKLKLHQKIRLATLGNAYCRQHLLLDPNRLVALAVINSPGITDSEVVRAAGNRSVNEDVIRQIANSRQYVKLYGVKLNLVQNPKTPLTFSLKLLPYLRVEDVKAVSKSKNVPGALAMAARKLAQERGPKS